MKYFLLKAIVLKFSGFSGYSLFIGGIAGIACNLAGNLAGNPAEIFVEVIHLVHMFEYLHCDYEPGYKYPWFLPHSI